MKDPEKNILMEMDFSSSLVDDAFNLKFLNVATRDWFNLPLPQDRYYYFWLDNMHFGFAAVDSQKIIIIDIKTGQVSKRPLSDKAKTQLSGIYPQVVSARWDSDTTDYVFNLEKSSWHQSDSKTGRFTLNWDSSVDGRPISVTDTATGQEIWRFIPSAGWANSDYAWSPTDESILAVVQGKRSLVDFDFPILNTTLYIYRVTTGKLLAAYQSDIGNIEWSPDGSRILYKDANSLYWNFGYSFTNSPCIFNIQTGENECVSSIPNRPAPAGYKIINTTDYGWSPDGTSIYFVYDFGSTQEIRGTLCVYDLLTGRFICSTDHLEALPEWSKSSDAAFWLYGWSISIVDFSHDRSYVHFCYSSNSHMSDDQGGPSNDGVIRMDGQGLLYWFSDSDPSRCSMFGSTWRPSP